MTKTGELDVLFGSPSAKFISLAMHALILLSILAIVFFFFIAKLEKQVFEEQIQSLVVSKIPSILETKDTTGAIKQGLQQLPLEHLEAVYNKPSEATVIYNKSLRNYIIIVNIVLGLLIVIPTLLIYSSCKENIPLSWIVIENVILFLFVGAFEYYFFQKVASKYVPVKPSVITNTLYTYLTDKLN